MQTSVIILSSHSLLAEGIARRLQEYLQSADLEIVDPRQADALARIGTLQPSIVILDTTDSEVAEHCPLGKLLLSFPEVRVICLDPQGDQIQVVTGEKRKVVEVRDLAEVIEQSVPSHVSEPEI